MGMTKNRKIGAVVKVAAGLITVLFASTAVADSTVTYSGYECLGVVVSGNQGGVTEGAQTSGTRTRCPLTRIVSNNTTDITSIIIRLKDTSPTTAISCHATSCSALGDSCSIGSNANTGTTFTGATSLGLDDVAAFNNGYAYIHCDVPNDSVSLVYSYRATD
jgi:hypothetical protein